MDGVARASAAADDDVHVDEDAADDRTAAERDRSSHPNSPPCNDLAGAWRSRSASVSASGSAKTRPKTITDEDN